MAKILEVATTEEFIEKLEKCESEEAAKKLWEEYNIDEIQCDDVELDESDLKDVAGGLKLNTNGLDWAIKNAKNVWKYAVDFGIICRAYYD